MYPPEYLTYIQVDKITSILEGKVRPTHFLGVTTVVMKLFNITKPHVAVFGKKDAQQVAVIKKMVSDLNVDLQIIVGPIVREPDGLAMSSRNVYLSPEERNDATVLFQALQKAQQLIASGERSSIAIANNLTEMISSKKSASIDYIAITDSRTLRELATVHEKDEVLISIAVRFGSTRLIDNIVITN
jgi:pantoate--beta-alanine ligase